MPRQMDVLGVMVGMHALVSELGANCLCRES